LTTPTQSLPGAWKTRIVGFDAAVDPEQLLANPANWRIHTHAQRAALEGVLQEVGFVDAVKVNRVTGNLVDGHMRVESAITNGSTVPVIYVELTPEEESIVLASFDPIGDLAKTDDEKLASVLADAQQANSALHQLLTDTLDFGIPAPAGQSLDADTRKRLLAISRRDPQHQVVRGDVWKVNDHVVACADVITEWASWTPYLDAGVLFAPFAGEFVLLTKKAETSRLLVVQPDAYLAALLLDRCAETLPNVTIARLVAGDASDVSDSDIDPTFKGSGRTDKRTRRKAGWA
jgi:hypothetical protein